MRNILFIVILFVLYSCKTNNNLGNNFYLLEGDRKEDRVIVFCSNKNGIGCDGGLYVVPSYKNHFDSKGNYSEYVLSAKSDKNWIIVETEMVNEKTERYWLVNKHFYMDKNKCDQIDCNSLIQEHVLGPFTHVELLSHLKEYKIMINQSDIK